MLASSSWAVNNRFSFAALSATVILAPLPFGSTDSAIVAVWCVVLGASLCFLRPSYPAPWHYVLLACVIALALVYAFVLHEQIAGAPWIFDRLKLWPTVSAVQGRALPGSASISPSQPMFAVGPSVANVSALVASFALCVDRVRARLFLKIIAWSGAGYALFSILYFFYDPTMVLWRQKLAYTTVLTGPFINRNTAATYFGCMGSIWLIFLISHIRGYAGSRSSSTVVSVAQLMIARAPRPLILSFAATFLCTAALFLTNSRAGVVISSIGFLLCIYLFWLRFLETGRRRAAAGTVVLLIGLLFFAVLGTGISSRFDVEGFADTMRWQVYLSTIEIIKDHPWIGTGLGTFALAFPQYRSGQMSGFGTWDKAHSVPLEIAAEMGVPATVFLCALGVVVLIVLLRGVVIRRRDQDIPGAAAVVMVISVVHSLVDFPLQTPGFSIVAFAIVGAGLAQAVPSGKQRTAVKFATLSS